MILDSFVGTATFNKLSARLHVDCTKREAEVTITYDRVIRRIEKVRFDLVETPAKATAWFGRDVGSERGNWFESTEFMCRTDPTYLLETPKGAPLSPTKPEPAALDPLKLASMLASLPRLDPRYGNRHFEGNARTIIKANGFDNIEHGFTIEPARYAKGKYAVRPRRDGSGWKTLEALLVPSGSSRSWSNRESAYIMSPRQAEKFVTAVIEAHAQQAAAPFSDAAYPGDTVERHMLCNDGTCGMIVVQDYGVTVKDGHRYKVGSFLPGETQFSPGDTPKTWPEKDRYVATPAEARKVFAEFLAEARGNGWIDYKP